MAVLTADIDRHGATADLKLGAWSPTRTTGPAGGDRSAAVSSGTRAVRSWPLLVLAAPAAAGVWSGWVGIAQKTGFGLVSPLPGIWPSLHLDTSITLPVGVEAYAAYALRAWLAERTFGFAVAYADHEDNGRGARAMVPVPSRPGSVGGRRLVRPCRARRSRSRTTWRSGESGR